MALFIHGFSGTAWKSWDQFPPLFHSRKDATTNSYEIAYFSYPHKPPLGDVIEGLRRCLREISDQYDTIALLCHSLGGVVAKLAIIDEILDKNAPPLKVDFILACCTPHLGIPACNLLHAVKSIPLAGKLIACHQPAAVAPWSPHIRRLRQYWTPSLIALDSGAVLPGQHYIRSITLSARDRLVSEKSARGFYVDQPDRGLHRGHRLTTDTLDRLFYTYLKDHRSPHRALEDIRQISCDANRKQIFFEQNEQLIAHSIAAAMPGYYPDPLSAARVFMQEFLSNFPAAPLRAVSDADDALSRYMSRKIKEWQRDP